MELSRPFVAEALTLLLCVALNTAAASQLQVCHANPGPCQNDGVCYRVAPHTNAHFCPSGFAPHDGQCYNFVQRKATWFEASRHCVNVAAQLAHFNRMAGDTAAAQRRREFLQAYSQQQMQSAKMAADVWIGARASGPPASSAQSVRIEWNWHPENESLRHPTFWAPFQPADHLRNFSYGGRADNACAAISSASDYYSWIAAPCTSRDKFYVCQVAEKDPLRDALMNDKGERYFYQCRCKQGYSGYNCENKPDPTIPMYQQQTEDVVCAGEKFEYACSAQLPGKPKPRIVVDMAMYGMGTNSVPQQCFVQNLREVGCASRNALTLLRQRCQGRHKCKLGPMKDSFSTNPCLPGTDAYLRYRARCIDTFMWCARGTNIGGRCFDVHTDKLTRRTAQMSCQLHGGDLAGPIDEEQHERLASMLMDYKPSGVRQFWLGLIVRSDGAFQWPGGALLAFTPARSHLSSASGDSSDRPHPCVVYEVSDDDGAVWTNAGCYGRHGYVCEYPPIENDDDTATDLLPFLVRKRYLPSTTIEATAPITTSTDAVTSQPVRTTPTSKPVVTEERPTPTSMSVSQSGVPYTCQPRIDSHGVLWPLAKAGRVMRQPCAKPLRGRMEWPCGPDGYTPPSGPFTHGCKHVWVDILQQEARELTRQTHESPAVSEGYMEVAGHLNKHLAKGNGSLVPGDIKGAVNVLDALVPVFRRQTARTADLGDKLRMASDFAREVGSTSDLLLSPSTPVVDVWNALPAVERRDAASTLMARMNDVVTVLAVYMAANGQQGDKMQWDNVEMDVTVYYTKPLHDDASVGSSEYEDPIKEQQFTPDGSDPSVRKTAVTKPSSNLGDVTVAMPSVGSLLKQARMVSPPSRPPPGRSWPFGVQDDSLVEDTSNIIDSVRLSYVRFDHLGPLLTVDEGGRNATRASTTPDGRQAVTRLGQVNAPVLLARLNEIDGAVPLADGQPAEFTFAHLVRGESASNPQCVWWDETSKSWSGAGCSVASTGGDITTCSCTHMTSFTVLMDITDATHTQIGETHRRVLSAITLIGCAVSVGCLAIALLVFAAFRTLWSERTTIHGNLCACLLLAELLFVFGIERTEYAAVCTGVSVLLHYLFLCAFMWMLFEGILLYKMLVTVLQRKQRRSTLVRCIIAYGSPAALVAASAALWTDDYGTAEHCWLRPMSMPFWLFVAPLALIICTNVVMLFVALNAVLGTQLGNSTVARIRGWLRGSCMLLCLLGVTWVFGFALVLAPMQPTVATVCAYVFTVANSLQGVFIFVLHVLMNERASAAIERQVYKWRANRLIAKNNEQRGGPRVKQSTDSFKPHWSSGSDSAYGSNSTGTTGTGGSRTTQRPLDSLEYEPMSFRLSDVPQANGHCAATTHYNAAADLSPHSPGGRMPTAQLQHIDKPSVGSADEMPPEQAVYVVQHF